MTWPALHLSQTIAARPELVTEFAGDARNLPRWAGGVSAGIRSENGRWFSDSPMGAVEIAFVGPVSAGVLDHDVTLPDGTVVHNPLRVLSNDEGSEVVFTLFRREGMTEDEFVRDAALVQADLEALRRLLEG